MFISWVLFCTLEAPPFPRCLFSGTRTSGLCILDVRKKKIACPSIKPAKFGRHVASLEDLGLGGCSMDRPHEWVAFFRSLAFWDLWLWSTFQDGPYMPIVWVNHLSFIEVQFSFHARPPLTHSPGMSSGRRLAGNHLARHRTQELQRLRDGSAAFTAENVAAAMEQAVLVTSSWTSLTQWVFLELPEHIDLGQLVIVKLDWFWWVWVEWRTCLKKRSPGDTDWGAQEPVGGLAHGLNPKNQNPRFGCLFISQRSSPTPAKMCPRIVRTRETGVFQFQVQVVVEMSWNLISWAQWVFSNMEWFECGIHIQPKTTCALPAHGRSQVLIGWSFFSGRSKLLKGKPEEESRTSDQRSEFQEESLTSKRTPRDVISSYCISLPTEKGPPRSGPSKAWVWFGASNRPLS